MCAPRSLNLVSHSQADFFPLHTLFFHIINFSFILTFTQNELRCWQDMSGAHGMLCVCGNHHKKEKKKFISPLFCSCIESESAAVGGADVCTSAKINVITKTLIHICVIKSFFRCRCGIKANGEDSHSIMSRCHLIINAKFIQ